MPSSIKQTLLHLLDDYRDFNSAPIVVRPIPGAVEFSKQVSKGYPCIYEAYSLLPGKDDHPNVAVDSALLDSPAYRWTKQDLIDMIPERVEVAVTPTGRADDIACIDEYSESVFLAPATIDLSLTELLTHLGASRLDKSDQVTSPVYYLQSQNSNLTTTPLAPLLKHLPSNFPFAEAVLGDPEAINIWIGDSRSITSTHRDPYENLYLVLKGSKTFTLYPPVDEITLPTISVRTGKYTFNATNSTFSTSLDPPETGGEACPQIPWISVNPLECREKLIEQHPMYAHSSPRTVTVREGQILYLPSGWFHHVQQDCGIWFEDGSPSPCIAVNYWYDMEYDGEKYVMRQLVGRLIESMAGESG